MPSYVLKNSHRGVGPWVVDLEEHHVDAFVAQYEDSGWSVDKKADPAEVAVSTAHQPAEQTGATKEKN